MVNGNGQFYIIYRFCITSAGVSPEGCKGNISLLVAMNDAWHDSVLYTESVANYSGMATRIQVFTELPCRA